MKNNNTLYFYFSLLFALWFLLTSWIWVYLATLFISLPFGLLSLYLLYRGKHLDERKERYNFVLLILVLGVVTSLAWLIMLMMNN